MLSKVLASFMPACRQGGASVLYAAGNTLASKAPTTVRATDSDLSLCAQLSQRWTGSAGGGGGRQPSALVTASQPSSSQRTSATSVASAFERFGVLLLVPDLLR